MCPFHPSGADGAAAPLRARTGIDDRLPDVAQRAAPPDLSVAAGRHHLRRQAAVERRVPLRRHDRLPCRKVVEPGEDLAPRAVGAVVPPHGPRRDDRQIAVAQRAPPPHLAVAGGRDRLRRQRAVFRRIPLPGQRRIEGGEVVEAPLHLFPAADGAVRLLTHPRGDGRLP